MTDTLSCSSVTYLQSTPDAVWHALVDAELTGRWWGRSNVSDWQVGSTWEHRRPDGSGVDGTGTVLESVPGKRLVMTFPTGEPSKVSLDLEQHEGIVRLTVTHEELPSEHIRDVVAAVWPAIFANLKSLLETGEVMSSSPLEMVHT